MITLSPTFTLSPGALVGRTGAILGTSGTGKSHTARLLMEQLIQVRYPFTLIDIEGEYASLPLFQGEIALPSFRAKDALTKRYSVRLDLSDTDDPVKVVQEYAESLWQAREARQPHLLILEEAHEFIPQGGASLARRIVKRLALRGRKYGLSVLVVSQRSAAIDKAVLTQARLLILHKVYHPADLEVYKALLPLPGAKVESMVAALEVGQAIVLHENNVRVVKIDPVTTSQGGATPPWEDRSYGQPEIAPAKLTVATTGKLSFIR